LINIALENSNEIVLDLFAGSGTTADAIMQLNAKDQGNRKFICVQLPETINNEREAFISGGFENIADISKERIRKVSTKLKVALNAITLKSEKSLFNEFEDVKSLDLGFKVFKLNHSNFKIWNSTYSSDPEVIQRRLFEHIDHIAPEAAQESILYELLLKSGFELTTPIQKRTMADKSVFSIADGKLLICLEKELTLDCIKAMSEAQPERVICLDEAFTGVNADALKTNAVQIMKSKGALNFRTV
jgi:adenine-specific DNA-methyltransferase